MWGCLSPRFFVSTDTNLTGDISADTLGGIKKVLTWMTLQSQLDNLLCSSYEIVDCDCCQQQQRYNILFWLRKCRQSHSGTTVGPAHSTQHQTQTRLQSWPGWISARCVSISNSLNSHNQTPPMARNYTRPAKFPRNNRDHSSIAQLQSPAPTFVLQNQRNIPSKLARQLNCYLCGLKCLF